MARFNLDNCAVVVWMPVGEEPAAEDFRRDRIRPPPGINPEAWWELRDALASIRRGVHGMEPWIKVGGDLLTPQRARRAYEQFKNDEAIEV